MLKEILENIFEQDKNALEIIEKNMGKDVVEQYPEIPTDIDSIINNINKTENIEYHTAFILDEEVKLGGTKFPEGSNVIQFKIKDIKIRRRKIFRLGDYYVSLIHSGLAKWELVFLTKSRALYYPDVNDNFEFRDHFYEAQHPHINRGKPCLSDFETPIRASINNYDIPGFLFQVKLYLNTWNYRSPHHSPESFEYIGHRLTNQNFVSQLLLNNYKYSNMFEEEIPYTDICNRRDYRLTSARCKAYETEPFSRIMYEQINWNSFNLLTIHEINVVMDIYFYLIIKYNEAEIEIFEHPHDCILYIRELFRLLDRVAFHQLKSNTYDWSEQDTNYLDSMINFKNEQLKYHTNYIDTSCNNRVYNDQFVYYLGQDTEQSSDISDKFARLNELVSNFHDIKHRNNTDEPTVRAKRELCYKYLGELFQNPDSFKTKTSLIESISDIQINKEDNDDKINIGMIIEEFESDIKPCLEKAMKTWIIDYHKKELRRLTDGKNKVNIEKLNI